MTDYRIELGFDLEGLPRPRGKIYLTSGVAQIQGPGRPETLWKYSFEPQDRVAFRVLDITTIFGDSVPRPAGDPELHAPTQLNVHLLRGRRTQESTTPLVQESLGFPVFNQVGQVYSAVFGRYLPGWDAQTDSADGSMTQFDILNKRGGFEATYQLTLTSGEEYAQDPEWIVGGGEDPPVVCPF